jgi:hypothetical protein
MSIWVIIGAIAVAFIIFTILVKIIQMTVKTAFTIAVIIFVLQFVFNVNVGDLIQSLLKAIFGG